MDRREFSPSRRARKADIGEDMLVYAIDEQDKEPGALRMPAGTWYLAFLSSSIPCCRSWMVLVA
jgi:hypothetical protein